jgi:ketosteroid isomerase-like protein
MKAALYAFAFLELARPAVSAQSRSTATVEQEIRRLDQEEATGLLKKDKAALSRLWAEDFTVNNPRNGITYGSRGVLSLIDDGTIDYASFDRAVEAMLEHGDTVISMGEETIAPVGKAPFAGRTVRRRFTHFWMKRDGRWRLTARHANILCADAAPSAAPRAGRD